MSEELIERLEDRAEYCDALSDNDMPQSSMETGCWRIEAFACLQRASKSMREAASTITALTNRIRKLEEALETIRDDAALKQTLYDRIGPQWTSVQGNEYEDTSSVLDFANEIAGKAEEALK